MLLLIQLSMCISLQDTFVSAFIIKIHLYLVNRVVKILFLVHNTHLLFAFFIFRDTIQMYLSDTKVFVIDWRFQNDSRRKD